MVWQGRDPAIQAPSAPSGPVVASASASSATPDRDRARAVNQDARNMRLSIAAVEQDGTAGLDIAGWVRYDPPVLAVSPPQKRPREASSAPSLDSRFYPFGGYGNWSPGRNTSQNLYLVILKLKTTVKTPCSRLDPISDTGWPMRGAWCTVDMRHAHTTRLPHTHDLGGGASRGLGSLRRREPNGSGRPSTSPAGDYVHHRSSKTPRLP